MNKNDQVTGAETAEILQQAESCVRLSGDFVELGCYKGETSVLLGKLLARCGKPVEKIQSSSGKNVDKQARDVDNLCKTIEKRLWIYDSFAGLPPKTAEDTSSAGVNFRGGELFVTKREVIDKIRHAGLKNVVIKKAWFEDLASQDLPKEIAFAFLDGDFYGSIKTSLKLVVPLMNPKGVIIVHDYNNPELPGSTRATDEFLRQHQDYKLMVKHTLAILQRAQPSSRREIPSWL